MAFLLPFFSFAGRPAMNQQQILRSFLLFLLLFLLLLPEGPAKPSLTLWMKILKPDRVLAVLIGSAPRITFLLSLLFAISWTDSGTLQ